MEKEEKSEIQKQLEVKKYVQQIHTEVKKICYKQNKIDSYFQSCVFEKEIA